jgi:hypothetical protein
MEETQDTSSKKGLKSEMIVAVAAIVVSVMTLFVYIFQARIMMDQQHTSVWPYVEWSTTFISEDAQEFYLEVVNKGVGPALIKQETLSLNGKEYQNYKEMLGELLGEDKRDALWIVYSSIDNRVLAPGESAKIFHVKNWKEARIPEVNYSGLAYSVCYCSIYDDCWITQGSPPEDSDCD